MPAFYGLESSGCFEAFSRMTVVEKVLAPDRLAVFPHPRVADPPASPCARKEC
jgi:hypothetical protein